jgi:hypothetical protein
MDRVAQYGELLGRIMERHARLSGSAPEPGVETVFHVDPARAGYLLMDLGWRNGRRVNDILIHARIKDGKIWVEEDWTEEGIATELVRAGVPKEDIVLGFQSPDRRHLTEFAVA